MSLLPDLDCLEQLPQAQDCELTLLMAPKAEENTGLPTLNHFPMLRQARSVLA